MVLDVLEDKLQVLCLLTEVLDGDGRGALDLSGVAFLIIVAVTEPFTKIVSGVNLDKRDATSFSHSLKMKSMKTEC